MACQMKLCVVLLAGVLFLHASAKGLSKEIDVDGSLCKGGDCGLSFRKLLYKKSPLYINFEGTQDDRALTDDEKLTTGRKLSGDVEDSPGMDDDDDDIDFASVNENKDGMSKDGNGHGCARTTYVT